MIQYILNKLAGETGMSSRAKLNAVIDFVNLLGLRYKIDNAINFTTDNLTWDAGYVLIEADDLETAPKIKLASGTLAYNDLPYFGGANGLPAVLAINNKTGGFDISSDDGNSILSLLNGYLQLMCGFGGVYADNNNALLFRTDAGVFVTDNSVLSPRKVQVATTENIFQHNLKNRFVALLHEFNNTLSLSGLLFSYDGNAEGLLKIDTGNDYGGIKNGDQYVMLNYNTGYVEIFSDNNTKIKVSKDQQKIFITAASVVKNGVEIATINDILTKVLTGLSITGSTILATDTVLQAFGKLQNQIGGLLGGSICQGVWNASTNSPALTSGTGTTGYYYIVNVAGATSLDGITDWKVGDWAIFINGAWNKVDNTDAVSSVNGLTGAVSMTTDNVTEGATNLYFTNGRALSAAPAETTTTVGALINGAGSKSTPIDADYVGLMDSAASNILKKLSWANIKTTMKAYLDVYYSAKQDGLVSGGAITVGTYGGSGTNNDIRVAAATWYIAGSNYSTGSNTDFLDIALSAAGLQRFIGLYGDNTNAITKVEGSESEYAVYPTTPAGKALIGYVLVTDSATTGTPDLSGYMLISSKASKADVIAETDDTKYVTALAASEKTSKNIQFNRQTASYTLVLTDRDKCVEMNVASANNLTVPLNSSVPFPIGSQIIGSQYGAGQTTIVATGGVTIRSAGGALKCTNQYAGWTLVKVGTNEWYAFGSLTT